MSLTITIPNALPGQSVSGGITFINGIATVPDLSTNSRAFFAAIGADVRGTPTPAPTTPAAVRSMKVAEIRAFAAQHNIELPARGARADLADATAAVLFSEE